MLYAGLVSIPLTACQLPGSAVSILQNAAGGSVEAILILM
jgi:hypothetical protein